MKYSCGYAVSSLVFDPQGKRLVSGGNSVALWEVPSGKRLFTLTEQERPIGVIAFDGQGLQLASGVDYLSGLPIDKTKVNSTLKVWEVLSGKLLVLPQDYPVDSLSFDVPGQHLAISLDEGYRVKMWEVASKKLLLELSADDIGPSSVAFDPQGKYLATTIGEKLTVWEMPTEKQRRASTTLHEERPHDEDWVKSITFGVKNVPTDDYFGLVAFDPQGRYLIADMNIWEVSSHKLVHTLPKGVGMVAFDQTGKLMVGAVGNTINWWEVGSWKLLQTLTLNESENLNESEKKVTFIAIDPQGKRIVGRLDDKKRNCYDFCTCVVKIWDATNGSLLTTFQHIGGVTSAAFTRNGQYLAVAGSEGYIAFYEVMTGQRFLSLHSLDNGGKLILLADGRFDGDEKGMEYLRYTEQGTLNSYSAKELKAQFFQPAAVKEALQKVGGK